MSFLVHDMLLDRSCIQRYTTGAANAVPSVLGQGTNGQTLMEPMDTQLLKVMREAIGAYRSDAIDVGGLADQLLMLHDQLQFTDHRWEHELTQQIATLDSASTFAPKDDEEARQVSHAISSAIDALIRLIESRLE